LSGKVLEDEESSPRQTAMKGAFGKTGVEKKGESGLLNTRGLENNPGSKGRTNRKRWVERNEYCFQPEKKRRSRAEERKR
jgi:hypothetical protein